MKIIVHRVNSIKTLKKIPEKYGVEIDLRSYRDNIILNHEPFKKGDLLKDYLKVYSHSFIIFNIKEAGIEEKVIELAKEYKIRNYFLLDVEFPYIYKATRNKFKKIAIRFSEDEPIEQALKYKGKVDWVWIDTNTRLPIDKETVKQLAGFRTCLVSPDRWGRPGDIPAYRAQMEEAGFKLDAVMCSEENIFDWEKKI
jgi:hypothetical protein